MIARGRQSLLQPEKLHQVSPGTIRDGEVQPSTHSWCGTRTVTGSAEGESFDRGRRKAFSGHYGQCDVSRAQVTRYDIGYAVNQLARGMSNPSKAHMAAAKHLLRYLTGTTDHVITYSQGGFQLTAFSDANWGNNPDNGKSASSYLISSSRMVPSLLR